MSEKTDAKIEPFSFCILWDLLADTCHEMNPEDELVVGRVRGDLIFKDKELSGTHCKLFYQNGSWYLQDLKSRNGTMLNSKEIKPGTPYKLNPFSTIVFGSHIFVFLNEEIDNIKGRQQLLTAIQSKVKENPVIQEIETRLTKFIKHLLPIYTIKLARARVDFNIDNCNMQKDKLLKKSKNQINLKRRELLLVKLDKRLDSLHNEKAALTEKLTKFRQEQPYNGIDVEE